MSKHFFNIGILIQRMNFTNAFFSAILNYFDLFLTPFMSIILKMTFAEEIEQLKLKIKRICDRGTFLNIFEHVIASWVVNILSL